jgi:PAS domain S-box-containing protein
MTQRGAEAPIRVLLVEDNPGDARLVEILLAEADSFGTFLLTNAKRLDEAIEQLERVVFHVVLLDLSLPDSSGLETVSRIRGAASELPIVVLSGQDDEETALWALQRGAEDYLVKGRGDGEIVARAIRHAIERQRIEVESKRSEQRFRALVRYASDIVSVLDADGTITYESPAVERILGFRPEERVGTNILDNIHPDDVGWVRHKLGMSLRGPEERTSTWYRVCDRRGEWRYFEAIATNLLNDTTVGGIVFNARDITERRQAEEALRQSEELYRTVVEQAAENIFLVDAETGRVLEANAALHASLGYAPEELKGMTLYDIVAHDRESVDRNIERTIREKRSSLERQYRRKDGSLADVDVSVRAISYGGREVMCIVAHDVTERKRMENNLRHSLDVLLGLYEAGQVLISSLDLEEIGPRLLGIMRRVANLTAALICLADEDGSLRVRHAVGPEELWKRARESPEASEARRSVMEGGQPRSFGLDRAGGNSGITAGLYLPLRVRGRPIGLLEAYGSEALAERSTVEVLTSFAGQVGSALENARLYGELAEREHRMRDLVGQVLAAQEDERRRVSYEVHDGLAQTAAAAHQLLQAFARHYSPDSARNQRNLERALQLVQQTVGEARQVIADLRPTALDDFGLATAVRQQVERLAGDGRRIDYEESLGNERLPSAVETALYRVAQESLTNIQKHAPAARVRVTLERSGQSVRLLVRDWGQGFRPEEVRAGSGPGERVGLSSMRERIALLGGSFEIRSEPGEGTEVVAEVPLLEDLNEG